VSFKKSLSAKLKIIEPATRKKTKVKEKKSV